MSRLAVILGASIAGLLAARALAPHFERVLLLERDSLPGKPEHRSGTAQAQHAHILLQRGLTGLEQMFPGYTKKLVDAGGVMTNATRDWYSLFPMGAFQKFESDMEFLCASALAARRPAILAPRITARRDTFFPPLKRGLL